MVNSAERWEGRRAQYLAMMERCASRQVLSIVSDKWATLILHALAEGYRRRGDLSREVLGASPKMLTQTLRSLERDGMVMRTVIPSVPVQVHYELTPLGLSLRELVCVIRNWSDAHIQQIDNARTRYEESGRGQAAAIPQAHLSNVGTATDCL